MKKRIISLSAICALAAAVAVCCICGLRIHYAGGRSMEPAIPIGSAVISIEGASAVGDIKAGDVVIFVKAGIREPIMHRVTAVNKDAGLLTTKGDNSRLTDGQTPLADVKGKVLFHIPCLGYISWLADNTAIRCIMAAAAAGLLVTSFTGPLKLRKKSSRDK